MSGDRPAVGVEQTADGFKIGDEKFVAEAIRTLWLKTTQLVYGRGIRTVGKDLREEHLSGEATLAKDSIAIAGDVRKSTRKISLALIPLPPEQTSDLWKALIGFLPFDWETSDVREDCFFIEIYPPQSAFQELLDAWRAGQVSELTIGARVDLFVRDHDRHVPPSSRLTWYLAPDEKGRLDSPRNGEGKIRDFRWTETRTPVAKSDDERPETEA